MTEPDGRTGQEAARLLAAAQDWLRTSAPHLAPVGDSGEPCSCPLCKAVVRVRDADPETVARWVDSAVTGVSAALASAAAAASPSTATSDRADAPDFDGEHADSDAASDDPPSAYDASEGDGPESGPVGHDGPGARQVRRIPLDGDVGPDLP